jgi:hypothetical protein
MALEFSDFGLSPEESVANRKQALESFSNLSGPALQEQQARERGQLLTQAYVNAANATKAGKTEDLSTLAGQAQMEAAKMLPSQGKQADEMNLQGATYREDIIASKQDAAATRYETQTAEEKNNLARQIANQAFEYGISADKLALAQDSYLADEGLKRLYSDYEAGRVNKADVQNLSNNLMMEAKKLEYAYQQEAAKLEWQMKEALANKNLEEARSLMNDLIARRKKVMETTAKANAMGAIMGGVFKIAATAVGTYFGGPAGGAAAAAGSSAIVDKANE